MSFNNQLEGWSSVKLKDISVGNKGNYGIGASAVEYDDSLYTYLRITDITDDGRLNKEGLMSVDDEDAKNYLLYEDDIVFARTGNSTGRSYFYEPSDGELVYAGFLIKFKLDRNKVNPRYIKLYTLTKQYRNWRDSFSTGSTRKNINAKMYGEMDIYIPPRKVQDNIVNIIEPLNKKIEINNKIHKNIEEMAQTIFKQWFIDFEFPNEDGKPYKSSGGKMVESELGMIPKEWSLFGLGDLFTFKKGKKPKDIVEKQKSETYQKYLTIDVLNQNSELFALADKVIECDDEDILMVMDGASSGNIYTGMSGVVGSTLAKLEVKDSKLKSFIYQLLKYKETDIKSHLTGSAIPHTDKAYISNQKIALPNNISVLKNSLYTFIIIMQKIKINNLETKKLQIMRDTLLPKLMSGEIRVNID